MKQHSLKSWPVFSDMRLLLVLVIVGLIASSWRPEFWALPSMATSELGQWVAPPARQPPEVALLRVERPELALWGLTQGGANLADSELVQALDTLVSQSKVVGLVLPYPVDGFELISGYLSTLAKPGEASMTGESIAKESLHRQIEQQMHTRELLMGKQVVLGLSSGRAQNQWPIRVRAGDLTDFPAFIRTWLWPLQQIPNATVFARPTLRYFPVLSRAQIQQPLVFESQGRIYAGFALALLRQAGLLSGGGANANPDLLWQRGAGVILSGGTQLPLSAKGTLVPLVTEYSTMTPSFAHLGMTAVLSRPVNHAIVLIGSHDDPVLERLAATMVALTEGLVLTEPNWFSPLNKGLLLAMLCFFLWLMPRISWVTAFFLCAALAVLLVAAQLLAQLLYSWWTPVGDLLWSLAFGLVIMQIWQFRHSRQLVAQRRLQLMSITQAQRLTELGELDKKDELREKQETWAELASRNAKSVETRLTDVDLATTLVMELEGPVLMGRYEIQREIGRGAMGTVYLAYDPKIERKVAIKTLNFKHFEEPQLTDIKARFFREAAAAGRLSHPNIVSVFDVGEEQDLAFIAMDHVDGQPLSKYVTEAELLPPFEVYRAMANVARALDYAHQNNIIHRDIKPANIMYCAQPYRLQVTDFGIARLVDESRTSTGEILGSPLYIAPEQIKGKTVTPSADIFSLGVTFYQLLTGVLPFKGDNLASLTYDIIYTKPPGVRKLRPELAASAARIINRALQKEATKRFESALEMAEAIEKAMRRDFANQAKAAGYIV